MPSSPSSSRARASDLSPDVLADNRCLYQAVPLLRELQRETRPSIPFPGGFLAYVQLRQIAAFVRFLWGLGRAVTATESKKFPQLGATLTDGDCNPAEIPMATNDNSHDKLFKSALADRNDAAMELRAVLRPTLVSQLDFSTLEPVPGSFIDEQMRGAHADILVHGAMCGQ